MRQSTSTLTSTSRFDSDIPGDSPTSSSSTLMNPPSSPKKGKDRSLGESSDAHSRHPDRQHQHHRHHLFPPIHIPTVPNADGEEIVPAATDEEDLERSASRRSQQEKRSDKADGSHIAADQVVEMIDGRPRDIYDRFSPARKRVIVAIVSYSAFLSPVTSSTFLPSIPQMAKDLNTSASVINYTVAVFLATIGIAPLFWSPNAGYFGRRPIYLMSMPIHVVASVGVALCQNVGQIFVTRIIQGCGGCAVLALGAGTIGDIYRPTERANAMGWFYSGALLGPSVAPLIAGAFTEYTALGWRSCQYWLAGMGALSCFLTYFFLPETSHPPLPHDILRQETGKKFVFYKFNPLTSVLLFRWPNISSIAFVSSCVMLETYCFVVPLAVIFETTYGVSNVTYLGCLYLATGGGNIIGGRIAGPWCDRTVRRYIEKRGHRRPEDRLRAAVFGSGVVMPLSALAYGWLINSGAGGIAPPLVMMIFSGVALMLVLTPVNTYLVDCMQTRSAEVIAVNNFLRYIFAAAASAFILPMANAIGWGWTMTFAAFISWIATGFILATIRWGHIWREKANHRYGMTEIAEDERHAASTDEENAEKARHSEEHGDEPGHLVPAPALRKTGRMGTRGESVRGPAKLVRQNSAKGEMPPVEEVLRRTVSLSGASAHGGG